MTRRDLRLKINEFLQGVKDQLALLWKSNLPNVAFLLIVGLTVAGLAMTYTEGLQREQFQDFWTSIWWAVVSMTTTGYGDIVPMTPVGRVIGAVVILSGVVLVSFFTATVSSLFVAARIREAKGLEQIHYHDHTVICGYGTLTRKFLESLKTIPSQSSSRVVLVADLPGGDVEELLANFVSLSLKFVRGDWTHEGILKKAGVHEAKTVVILPDEEIQSAGLKDEKTILATLAVKALNPRVRLLVHITIADNKVFLQRAQAEEIFIADEHTGFLLASRILSAGIPQAAREIFSSDSPSRINIAPIPVEMVGKTFGEIADYFFKRGAILIGLTREETPLEAADILSSDSSALDEFIRYKFQQAGLNAMDRTLTRTRINPARENLLDPKDRALIIGQLE